MAVDYERSFRHDVIDHEHELVVRGELPGVKIDDIEASIMGDRLIIEGTGAAGAAPVFYDSSAIKFATQVARRGLLHKSGVR